MRLEGGRETDERVQAGRIGLVDASELTRDGPTQVPMYVRDDGLANLRKQADNVGR